MGADPKIDLASAGATLEMLAESQSAACVPVRGGREERRGHAISGAQSSSECEWRASDDTIFA